jgi:hypothetical protein
MTKSITRHKLELFVTMREHSDYDSNLQVMIDCERCNLPLLDFHRTRLQPPMYQCNTKAGIVVEDQSKPYGQGRWKYYPPLPFFNETNDPRQ